jgi:hypothetical protein
MKKIFSILTLVCLSVVFLAPLVASAETVPNVITKCTLRHNLSGTAWENKGFVCPASGDCLFDDPANPTRTCGICCTMDTVYTITDWIFLGVVTIAGIMILIGAFNIVTAGGSPEKVNTGRSYIIFAAVGIIIALIAKLIPTIAKNIIGLG